MGKSLGASSVSHKSRRNHRGSRPSDLSWDLSWQQSCAHNHTHPHPQLWFRAHVPAQIRRRGPKLYSQVQEPVGFRREIWLIVGASRNQFAGSFGFEFGSRGLAFWRICFTTRRIQSLFKIFSSSKYRTKF